MPRQWRLAVPCFSVKCNNGMMVRLHASNGGNVIVMLHGQECMPAMVLVWLVGCAA